MSDLSTYLRNELYDHVFRNAAFTSPTTVYVALFTDGVGTEVSATGYARQDFGADAPTDGVGDNAAAITFGPLTGSSGTATHFALYDAVSAGNRLTQYVALAASTAWADGDSLQFNAGDLDASIQ